MSIICPTILAENEADYEQQLGSVNFADRIQIDLMDGVFTNSISLQLSQISSLPNQEVDLHVMYQQPANYFEEFVRLKPSMVIVQAESSCDIPFFAHKLRENGIKTGLCLLQETTVTSVEYLFPHIQHLLIFSGNLGQFGGSANLSLTRKITEAKTMTNYLEYGWDGGANSQVITQLVKAGVDVINVGGAIQNSNNKKAAYDELVKLVSA